MTDDISPAQYLTTARDRIIENGWFSAQKSPSDGGMCAMMAIGSVRVPDVGSTWNYLQAVKFLASSIGIQRKDYQDYHGDVFGIVVWNDEYGRTKDDVLDAFDRAITLAEETPCSS